MVSYKELGLVNTREMFRKAMEGKYAIAAFNFNNMEQMQAIIQAAVECQSPVILQVSSGARKYANQTLLRYMAQGAVEYAKELGCAIPVTLHLDHGDTFELCKSCIDMGFSSVMIDGSHHSYDENVELTRRVVEYAHQYDVTVEGELGVLAGVEDEVSAEHHTYTRPEEVEDFVSRPVLIHSLFQSVLHTVPTNSAPSNALATKRVSSFLLPYASTSSKRSRNVSPASPSYCTALQAYLKTR